jgi:hypothetical protein
MRKEDDPTLHVHHDLEQELRLLAIDQYKGDSCNDQIHQIGANFWFNFGLHGA